jgi:hypothetical protein
MVCEYNSKYTHGFVPGYKLGQIKKKVMRMMESSFTTPVRTRNVSQSVACRVVGMTWVIYAV